MQFRATDILQHSQPPYGAPVCALSRRHGKPGSSKGIERKEPQGSRRGQRLAPTLRNPEVW